MKQSKAFIGLKLPLRPLSAALAAVVCLIAAGTVTGCGSRLPDKAEIAMILKSSESNFWKTVIAGAETASHEYHVSLQIEAPETEEDYETQNRYLKEAIARQADAIIFSANDYNKSVELIERAIDEGIQVVIIDSDVNSSRVKVHIGTDNYAAGRQAGQAALDGPEEVIKVGLVNFDVNTKNGQERENGCRDALAAEERAQVTAAVNVGSNIPDASNGTKRMLAEHPEINVIVTFNEWTTLGVGYAIKDLGLKNQVRVIGFDNNVTSIGMLETGEMDALIVQNMYAMGYLSVEKAYERIGKKGRNTGDIWTDTVLITKANMYTPENQKILFNFQ